MFKQEQVINYLVYEKDGILDLAEVIDPKITSGTAIGKGFLTYQRGLFGSWKVNGWSKITLTEPEKPWNPLLVEAIASDLLRPGRK